METIAAYLHAARPRKAMVREVIRGHADDATLGPRDPVGPLAAANNLDEKSYTSDASEFSAGCGLFSSLSQILLKIGTERGQSHRRGQCIRQRQRTADPLGARPLPAVASDRSSLCARRNLAFSRYGALL